MLHTAGSLEPFIAALTSDPSMDYGAAAAAIIRGRLRSPGGLAPFARFEPSRYTRNLIFRNSDFEVIALYWSTGSASPIHDHGASRCAMAVYRGRLSVEYYTIVHADTDSGYAKLDASGLTILEPGDIDVRTAKRDLHRVCSPAGTHDLAPRLRAPARSLSRVHSGGTILPRRHRPLRHSPALNPRFTLPRARCRSLRGTPRHERLRLQGPDPRAFLS